VADAPVDKLVGRADELARLWAVSLISARALPQMAGVPLQQLAREAPALCEQLLRALASDAELARLLEPPATREHAAAQRSASNWGWIAPDGDAAGAVHDVDALRSVVWAAVLSELRNPPPSQVADLADRLAFVCASLLAVVLARHTPPQVPAGIVHATHGAAREQVLYSSPPRAPRGGRAVLIDELAEANPPARGSGAPPAGAWAAREQSLPGTRGEPAPPVSPVQRTGTPRTAPRARPWDTPLDASPAGERSRQRDAAPGTTAMPPEQRGGPEAVRVTRGPGSLVDERV
jgi:hypothetical protein